MALQPPCYCSVPDATDCPRHDDEVHVCSKNGCGRVLEDGACPEHPTCGDCGEHLEADETCPYRECPGKAA